jgi:hypothetical protein
MERKIEVEGNVIKAGRFTIAVCDDYDYPGEEVLVAEYQPASDNITLAAVRSVQYENVAYLRVHKIIGSN